MLTTIIRQKAISTPGDSAFLASVELIEKPTTRPMTASTPRVFAPSLGIWASLAPCNCSRHPQFCETRQHGCGVRALAPPIRTAGGHARGVTRLLIGGESDGRWVGPSGRVARG